MIYDTGCGEAMEVAIGLFVRTEALVAGLRPDTERMRRNLDLTGGLIFSEGIMMKVAQTRGKHDAHDLVYDAAMTAPRRQAVLRTASDDADIPMLAKMAKAMHEHGALAGVQLAYSGINGPNLYTKEVPRGPSALPIRTFTNDPVQARAMDKQDIRDLRRWHRNAFRRAKQAGFDLVCLYGAHGFGIIQHFLSTATNQRTDEYGGSLENRTRLMRELIEEGRDAIGDTCGLTLRISLDEMIGELGFANSEVRDMIEMHADLPDLWDLAHGAWEDCSATRSKDRRRKRTLYPESRTLPRSRSSVSAASLRPM